MSIEKNEYKTLKTNESRKKRSQIKTSKTSKTYKIRYRKETSTATAKHINMM